MKLISDNYSIRGIREEDLKMLLSWRNSDRIRNVMLTDHEITWEEHYNWFKRNEQNYPPRNLIFEYKGMPIGYIGYTDYDEDHKTCSPGCYLGDAAVIPIDAGFVLFVTTIDYAFKILDMKVLRTEVFKNNKRVVKLDKILGYRITNINKVSKNGNLEETYTMELLHSEWDVNIYGGGYK